MPPARPKRLRFTVFTLAGRLLLRVGAEAERLAGLIAARGQLLRLAHAPPVG